MITIGHFIEQNIFTHTYYILSIDLTNKKGESAYNKHILQVSDVNTQRVSAGLLKKKSKQKSLQL